jgi:hypothetical protein
VFAGSPNAYSQYSKFYTKFIEELHGKSGKSFSSDFSKFTDKHNELVLNEK